MRAEHADAECSTDDEAHHERERAAAAKQPANHGADDSATYGVKKARLRMLRREHAGFGSVRGGVIRRGTQTNSGKILVSGANVDDEAEDHADAGRGKTPVPSEARALREITADEWTEEGAQVHTHVEDRESRVAPRVAGPIDLSYHRRNVRLEEARADDDEGESDVKRRHPGNGQREMAERDDQAADHQRPPRADHAIGEIPADQRRQVHEHRIRTVEIRRSRRVPFEGVDEIEYEDGAHPVVREALPHLGDEEQTESAWMTEECAVVELRGPIGGGGSDVDDGGHDDGIEW